MFDYQIKSLHKKLDFLIRTKKLTVNNRIFFFGVNEQARETISYLRKKAINVAGVTDNNKKKQGSYCQGVKVIAFKDIDSPDDGNTIFLLYSRFWKEMYLQLINMQISKNHIYKLCSNIYDRSLIRSICYTVYGKRIFENIKKKYPGHYIFLAPYTGTGDAYLIGTLLPYYLKMNCIKDYVIVVVNSICARVLRIFGINNIENLGSQIDCDRLVKYYLVCPEECNIKILNDGWGEVYTNHTEWLRGFRGLNFTQMFTRFVFEIPADSKPIQPLVPDNNELDEIFEKHNLRPGKTVVLSPYSTTLASLPSEIWVRLASVLKQKGFDVCTNASPDDIPVAGTDGVFVSLEKAPQFVQRSGYFIGVRSGFCDVISASGARKIILYDKYNYFYNCPAYEYFSLNSMGLSDDAVELIWSPDDDKDIVEEIAANIY